MDTEVKAKRNAQVFSLSLLSWIWCNVYILLLVYIVLYILYVLGFLAESRSSTWIPWNRYLNLKVHYYCIVLLKLCLCYFLFPNRKYECIKIWQQCTYIIPVYYWLNQLVTLTWSEDKAAPTCSLTFTNHLNNEKLRRHQLYNII